ncbi:TPR domain protein [Curvularia clavata]|uniref:TPR domain protein n=1 Tax=Curvularia clavata TaxID=95742 RepID=A0A9Q9DNT1_CURCL|nr:TPR domain protein [Curvularia clavata]
MASTVSFRDKNYGIQGGIINGNVDATFHLPLERQETPPPPSILIPFARDADFVERGTILDQVDQICAAPNARAALVGLGGVGKSQLAIEYAYRTRERSPETWVFWVHASNAARFEQGFRDIADRVKIYGRQDPQANIFKLVHDWLCSSKHRWLLVLDNVDDPRFLLENRTGRQGQTGDASGTDPPLREHLPHCDHGSILVTTRNKEAALKLVEQRDIVFVEPMDKAEGIALFEKKLGAREDNDRNSIADLVAALENMPLAIVQAAAYISERKPRCSSVQYLDEFRRSDHGKTSLLACEAGQLRRDREAKNSIIITWQISFEHLRQTKPSAADLLSLMSFFDRQGIPESLIHDAQKTNRASSHSVRQKKSLKTHFKHLLRRTRSKPTAQQDEAQSNSREDRFENDVIALRNLCFISIVEDGATFQMHRLVQLAMRKWLAANGKLEWWKQRFISNLCAAFPTGEYENWPTCQALYAHAKSAMAQQPEEKSLLVEWATLLYRASWYAYEKGNAAEAETLALQSMKARKKVLGREHENTLESVGMVGLAYKLGGRWDDAEKLQVQVMETLKTKLGADHPEALRSIANLASTYREQGRFDEAEALDVQVMETRKTKLGIDHPDTLMSIANLALIHWNQGRLDEAEALYVQVLETSKTKLGVDHLGTLTSMHNLALVYWNQGRLDEAEVLGVQVMETFKTKLGTDHPDTLMSIANLASTYRNQGRLDEAEALLVQVLETRKTKLGVDHPETLRSIANLASTYRDQGRLDEAETLQVQVMETSKTKLGVDHPFTLNCMHNLAYTWKAQGRTADAVVLMRQCLQQRQQVQKTSHPEVQASLEALEEWETE